MGAYMKKSPLGNLTNDQFNNAYFCWDVYNASSSTYNLVAAFYDETGMEETSYTRLIESCLPQSVGDIRMTSDEIEAALPRWENNGSVKNTRADVSVDDIRAILKELFVQ
jgi:hypothetical protein